MSKQQQLQQKFIAEFEPHFLLIENESHLHSSGRGTESHFKVVLVSDKFIDVTKVARHRLVYQLVAEELKQGIHALVLHLYTKQEWDLREHEIPVSTNCLGHGK